MTCVKRPYSLLVCLLCFCWVSGFAPSYAGNAEVFRIADHDSIPISEVQRVMNILAGDSLQGRGNFQPGLLKAALFIGDELGKMRLQPLPGHHSFFIPFRPAGGSANTRNAIVEADGIRTDNFLFLSAQPLPPPTRSLPDFQVVLADSLTPAVLLELPAGEQPILVWSSSQGAAAAPQNIRFLFPVHGLDRDVLILQTNSFPSSLVARSNEPYYRMLEYNIGAVLPGSVDETIVLSAHYDHEGIVPDVDRDTILNGANDNASGTTAVLTMAKQLSAGARLHRTVAFVFFAGEELGLTGSLEMAATEPLSNIIANINIEMIGIPELGKRTVFITGKNDSNLPGFLRKELILHGLRVSRDPVPDQLLYERSDNYSFALRDIPAHTIMASTDRDECYHQPCDELKRINFKNMTLIINAIYYSLDKFTNGTIAAAAMK